MYHAQILDLKAQLDSETQFTEELTSKIKIRDEEILRLHDMYNPGQNLEKINLKFIQEQNETVITKL